MEEMRFDDRVAIVTGAGGDLGTAYVLELAGRGASVVINDLPPGPTRLDHVMSAHEVAEQVRATGGRASAVDASVTTKDGARQIVGAAIDAFGRVDVVVNNAGLLGNDFIEDLTE